MIRRYSPIKPSRGTTWPPAVRQAIHARDGSCVGPRVFTLLEERCSGSLEIDHVRASGGIGLKSRSTVDNGVLLCGRCHRLKTENGKVWRPLLLAYLARQ